MLLNGKHTNGNTFIQGDSKSPAKHEVVYKEENMFLKQQLIHMKLEMKSKIEENLLRQKSEMKSIMKEYIDFIDKILVDKKQLKNQLLEVNKLNVCLQQELEDLRESSSRYIDSQNQHEESNQQNYFKIEGQELDDAKRSIKLLKYEVESSTGSTSRQHKRSSSSKQSFSYQESSRRQHEVFSFAQRSSQYKQSKSFEVEQLLGVLEQENKQAFGIIDDLNYKIQEMGKQHDEKLKQINQQFQVELENFEDMMLEAVKTKDGSMFKLRKQLVALKNQSQDLY